MMIISKVKAGEICSQTLQPREMHFRPIFSLPNKKTISMANQALSVLIFLVSFYNKCPLIVWHGLKYCNNQAALSLPSCTSLGAY